MSKGLEALEEFREFNLLGNRKELCDTIEKELQRLESIDNANPSEAMNCLHIIAFNTQFIAGMNFGNELRAIERALFKAKEQEKENELLKEIIKSLFDRGCPLHQYMDNKRGLTIEVDDECSIMQLGEFKGVNLDEKLKEVLADD